MPTASSSRASAGVIADRLDATERDDVAELAVQPL